MPLPERSQRDHSGLSQQLINASFLPFTHQNFDISRAACYKPPIEEIVLIYGIITLDYDFKPTSHPGPGEKYTYT